MSNQNTRVLPVYDDGRNTPPIALRRGDIVWLSSSRWYTVVRPGYRRPMGYTSSGVQNVGEWVFVGCGQHGNRQLQVSAIQAVERANIQIYPPSAEQPTLFDLYEGDVS